MYKKRREEELETGGNGQLRQGKAKQGKAKQENEWTERKRTRRQAHSIISAAATGGQQLGGTNSDTDMQVQADNDPRRAPAHRPPP